MLMFELNQLLPSHLEALVTNGVSESRTLDFKRDAVGTRDEDKREFLADICAFANTMGGDMVFGIDEAQGIATSVSGIVSQDPDAEILRLDSIVRTGLEPRLPKIDFKWVPLTNGRGILVIRTPKSWAAPHRVTFREHNKFYARSSAGKYALDIAEIRSAFLASEAVPERIRRFRQERVSAISANEAPLPIRDGAKLIVHLIPLSAFTDPRYVALDRANRNASFRPLGASGWNFTHTLEGLATYSGPEENLGAVRAYTLAFRNGIVEAVAGIGNSTLQGQFISLSGIEETLLTDLPSHFRSLTTLGIDPPFYVSVTLSDVRGYQAHVQDRWGMEPLRPLRRDVVMLPELIIDAIPAALDRALHSNFNLLWNSFGLAQSPNFDRDGAYVRS